MDENMRFSLQASATAQGNRRGEVMIYSVITRYKWNKDDPDVTSNDFDKQLKALGDVDEITVRINSPGGLVNEAIAIRTTLMLHPAKKIVNIEGDCASAATLIACMPQARVRIAKGGTYMIHRCSGGARGHAEDMMAAYNAMKKTDEDMADIYAERTGKSAEECLALMKAETWFKADEAVEAGFADEILTGGANQEPLAACAVTAEVMELMRACYAHAPDHQLIEDNKDDARQGQENVSNEASAANASEASSSENNNEGVCDMEELRNATAEQLENENPELAKAIASDAITQERERVKKIKALTRKGEKWQQMADKAIAEGTSAADFLEMVIAEEGKDRAAYLEGRQKETDASGKVGGGDSGDNDDREADSDKEAKKLADLADSMDVNVTDMY